jgi:hypothetical protein
MRVCDGVRAPRGSRAKVARREESAPAGMVVDDWCVGAVCVFWSWMFCAN